MAATVVRLPDSGGPARTISPAGVWHRLSMTSARPSSSKLGMTLLTRRATAERLPLAKHTDLEATPVLADRMKEAHASFPRQEGALLGGQQRQQQSLHVFPAQRRILEWLKVAAYPHR